MPPSSHGNRLGGLVQRECQAAAAALAVDGDLHAGVHEARKAIRRARSLLALAAPALDVEGTDNALRRIGDSLGALRDAHVVAATAARVGDQSDDPAWVHAAQALDRRADRLLRRELATDAGFARRRRAIGRAARQLESLPWDELAGTDIRDGVHRHRRGADAGASPAGRNPQREHLPRWRGRVRRLRMQLDALDALRIRSAGHDPVASKRLHHLSDELGRRQDLAMLAEVLLRLRTLERRRQLVAHIEHDGTRQAMH